MANKKGGGSKLLTGIICFFVGFIMAIAAEVAVIAGAIYWLYNSDLDTIFDTFNITNTEEDESTGETKYIYINTSELTTVSDLISKLQSYSDTGFSELTIGEIEDSFPIVGSLVDLVYQTVDSSIESLSEEEIRELIPEDGLKATKLGELVDYLKDCLGDLKVEVLLEMAGIDIEDNVVYLALAYGADGYYYDSSDTLVVTGYKTVSELMEDGIDSVFYEIYINDFIDNEDGSNDVFIEAFDGVTVGDFMDGIDLSEQMSDILVTDLLGNEDDVVTEMFEGMTLGELMNDGVDVDDLLSKVYVPEVMDVSVDNGVMAFIGYSLTGVEASSGLLIDGSEVITYSYEATLHLYTQTEDPLGTVTETETTYTAYAVVDGDGYITNVYYYDDTSILTEYRGVAVNEISEQSDRLMDTVTIGDMVTFNSDTKLTQKIAASTINGIGDVIDNLTLVDAMDGVDATDSAVILYITYGVSGFEAAGTYTDGNSVTYNVYKGTYHSCTASDAAYDDTSVYILADSTGEIVGMYADTSYTEEITPTLVNDASARIDALMDDLPIGDIIDTSGSVILDAISDSTINSLADDIDNLAVQTVFYDEIYAKVDAAGLRANGATVDSYLKVVYESLTGGTYYNYSGSTLTEVTGDTSSYLAAGTLYWTDGSKHDDGNIYIYQVVEYDEEYLYLDSEFEFVEYEMSGSEYIRGHISDANYNAYKSNIGGILYTYGKPEGTWYYMLYAADESDPTKLVEHVYSVDNIQALTSNATDNIEDSTLKELVNTGLITSDYLSANISTPLYASILYNIYNTNGDIDKAAKFAELAGNGGAGDGVITMGDLTLSETMDLLVYILNGGTYTVPTSVPTP